MSDIVERLRETIVAYDEWYQGQLKTSDTLLERFSRERHEAAAEITRLRAENEKLREALKPFACIYQNNGLSHSMFIFEMKDLLAAKKALESGDE